MPFWWSLWHTHTHTFLNFLSSSYKVQLSRIWLWCRWSHLIWFLFFFCLLTLLYSQESKRTNFFVLGGHLAYELSNLIRDEGGVDRTLVMEIWDRNVFLNKRRNNSQSSKSESKFAQGQIFQHESLLLSIVSSIGTRHCSLCSCLSVICSPYQQVCVVRKAQRHKSENKTRLVKVTHI